MTDNTEKNIDKDIGIDEDSHSTPEAEEQAPTTETAIDDSDLQRYVEAMIFSSAAPLPTVKISQALNISGVSRVKKAVAALNEGYEATERSFRIRQVGGGYQYYVLPQWAECLKKLFTRTRKIRLTKAALETMAVVAYKQPVSKNQIEFIRGVACDGVLHNLLEKNLIKISGRAEGAGRSLLYSATDEFLRFFGLNSFDDLPRIAEIEELIQQVEVDRADRADDSDCESDSSDESAETCEIDEEALDSDSIEDAIATAIDSDFDNDTGGGEAEDVAEEEAVNASAS